MKQIPASFTGFDSAWTDNPRKPGAIASVIHDNLGGFTLVPPIPATFSVALDTINEFGTKTSTHIIGIDQPTIVPNIKGNRPVERVVAHVIGKMKGGVQPSNRSKRGMFNDSAPIWRFLSALPHQQSPERSVKAEAGSFLLEVFPALTILGLFPVFKNRGMLPKYNPENRKKFSLWDWRLLTDRVSRYGLDHRIEGLSVWVKGMMDLREPKKADQDALDAVICAIQAFHWWSFGYEESVVVGDPENGYMVTATSSWMRTALREKCEKRAVPFNKKW